MSNQFDCIIIGGGMSGLAAGIRLAMYNQKVVILEKHTISGGLNSYYNRGKRKFDVGLHALTNYIDPKEKGKPFNKLMKQLRIPYEEFKLCPQNYSVIQFPEKKLLFANNIEIFISEIHEKFPQEIDGFLKLLEHIKAFDEVNLTNQTIMAKTVVKNFIKSDELLEMIFCPLLIYGSAWENDMDFSQFVIMFKSIFMEGFSRPVGGVRTILDLLLKRFEELGGELRFKSEVTAIIEDNEKISAVEVNHEEVLTTKKILSSMGLPETYRLITKKSTANTLSIGRLSFTESIVITKEKPKELGIDATIVFLNNRPQYLYQRPVGLIDQESAVVCFPNNFLYNEQTTHDDYAEGVMRVTYIANYDEWNKLKLNEDKSIYKSAKENVFEAAKKTLILSGARPNFEVVFKDVFTPTTIERYTSHIQGVVYGSTTKSRDGKTPIEGLYICGTDQGFLGIVGSMLSGISMANLHVLQPGSAQ